MMKQWLLRSIASLFAMLIAVATQAQTRTISGKVTSAEDGSPLPGVTVQIKGTNTGTQTDAEGKFSINAPENATLVFRFVGLKTQEIAVGGRSSIDVRMEVDERVLSEVVVTGYGAMEKREITGSIASVRGDVIQNLPLQSFDRALQGRAAGVLVQAANGVPGGAVSVRIRGIGSITAGNEPLYIVDGVVMNNASTTNFVSSNPLAFLNPNDIESIEVLKDAAAASVYGAQAGNGVVLVTTKKGRAGRTEFNLNYYYGSVEPIRYMRVLNSQQWIQVRTEAVRNQNPALTEAQARSAVLTSIRLPGNLTDEQIAALPTYDWQRAAYRQGIINNIELSARGGNEKTTFALSGSYNQQDANVIAVDFKRATGRMAVQHQVNNKLRFETSINLSNIKQRGPFGSPAGGSFLGSPSFSSPLIIPTNPIYNEDGSYFGTPATGGLAGILNQNVIMNAEYNTILNVTRQVVGNAKAVWNPFKEVTVSSFYGLDYREIKGEYYADPRTADGFGVRGRLTNESEYNATFTANPIVINFAKNIGSSHKLNTTLATEYVQEVFEGINQQITTFPTSQFRTANTGATPVSIGGFWTSYRRAGVAGIMQYGFKNRYFVNAVLRRDGSSRFGKNNLYGTFGSVSAAWLLTEESFLKDKVEWIDEIKLRVSYGSTGNSQIGNFDSRGLFGGGFNYGNDAGIAPTNLNNPTLRWERQVNTEGGLDLALFNRRLTSTIGYFNKESRDLLLDQPVPWTSGYSSITSNVGRLYNRGVEFELNTVNVDTRGFKWTTSFNVTKLENKVTRLAEGDTVLPGNPSVRLGHPLGAIFTAQYAGVNPATGRPMWYDRNGNITYLPQNPADFRVLGSGLANLFGGFTNTFSYKGLELTIFFQYEFGRKAFNNQNSFLMENGGRLFNSLLDVFERRWTTPGQITDVPRPINGNAEVRGASHLSGSRTLEDASYIRLKQLTLAYNLPQNLTQKVKINRARLYAQAINLITWTKWTGYDPEFLNLGAGNNGVVPQSRNYTFGVEIGF
ncbi:MAG: TonB-dependent receptor [Cytophagales bacterium]|nr:TonB-dependent receptor [Cytophagales bacterium]